MKLHLWPTHSGALVCLLVTLQAIDQVGALLRMVLIVIRDMRYFFMLLIFLLISFGLTFSVLMSPASTARLNIISLVGSSTTDASAADVQVFGSLEVRDFCRNRPTTVDRMPWCLFLFSGVLGTKHYKHYFLCILYKTFRVCACGGGGGGITHSVSADDLIKGCGTTLVVGCAETAMGFYAQLPMAVVAAAGCRIP